MIPVTTKDRVIDVICKELKFDKQEISEEMRLSEDLKADSLDFICLSFSLEREFNIPDLSDVENAKTVADVIKIIKNSYKLLDTL